CAVRLLLVVVSAPSLAFWCASSRLYERMRVQTFGSEFALERFGEGIISELARPGEVQRDAALIGAQVEIARDEFAALIDADCLWESDPICARGDRGYRSRPWQIMWAPARPRCGRSMS